MSKYTLPWPPLRYSRQCQHQSGLSLFLRQMSTMFYCWRQCQPTCMWTHYVLKMTCLEVHNPHQVCIALCNPTCGGNKWRIDAYTTMQLRKLCQSDARNLHLLRLIPNSFGGSHQVDIFKQIIPVSSACIAFVYLEKLPTPVSARLADLLLRTPFRLSATLPQPISSR